MKGNKKLKVLILHLVEWLKNHGHSEKEILDCLSEILRN